MIDSVLQGDLCSPTVLNLVNINVIFRPKILIKKMVLFCLNATIFNEKGYKMIQSDDELPFIPICTAALNLWLTENTMC